ncbi:MAG TPA: hypothetical protein VMS31_12510, partial [Pyrinomonadaceae bacterium]|nr:hypothetical protein [Pyrinomonadaceae bacterium]
ASVLPAASFRFHLAMVTLAVRLTIPPVGFVGDFHSQVSAPCRAHQRRKGDKNQVLSPLSQIELILDVVILVVLDERHDAVVQV